MWHRFGRAFTPPTNRSDLDIYTYIQIGLLDNLSHKKKKYSAKRKAAPHSKWDRETDGVDREIGTESRCKCSCVAVAFVQFVAQPMHIWCVCVCVQINSTFETYYICVLVAFFWNFIACCSIVFIFFTFLLFVSMAGAIAIVHTQPFFLHKIL